MALLLFVTSQLYGWRRLLMEGETVLKLIKNFKPPAKDKQKTCLAAIKRAYAAAERAASEAKRAGNPQYLVTCASPPRLVKTGLESERCHVGIQAMSLLSR